MKRLKIFFAIFLFLGKFSYSQNVKGFSVAKPEERKADGKTYALIVGISKYRDKEIPSLEYADKDAMAFYNFLRATGVDSDNIVLRLNNEALKGTLWADVNYLLDLAKKGDKVFIYFSCHGDVEHKTIVQQAYLLPYDSKSVLYADGAISIPTLKDYLATLSANGVQLIFIADACRSGNLAGGKEGITETAKLLSAQWSDEIKILSCQPGESSLESKQWGGGRGLFSFELINALAGKADRNKDKKVSLHELELYLSEKVPDEASPSQQYPVVEGTNKDVVLSEVTPSIERLAIMQETSSLATVDIKGSEKILLAGLNDSIKFYYHSFQTCMDSGNYLLYSNADKPDALSIDKKDSSVKEIPSAIFYYHKIPVSDSTHALLAYMKRNLSAVIMNDLQGSADTSMNAKVELTKKLMNGKDAQSATDNIVRFMNESQLKTIALRELIGDDKLKKLGFYSKALLLQTFPYLLNPTPKSADAALAMLDTALVYSPDDPSVLQYKAQFELSKTNTEAALTILRKLISLSPKYSAFYLPISQIYLMKSMPDSARIAARTYLDLEKDQLFQANLSYSKVMRELDQLDSAKFYFHKALQYPYPFDTSMSYIINSQLSSFAASDQLCDEADAFYRKAIAGGTKNYFSIIAPVAIAGCFAKNNDKENALKFLELAFSNGYNMFKKLKNEPSLLNIRNTPEFKTLAEKYFPDKAKTIGDSSWLSRNFYFAADAFHMKGKYADAVVQYDKAIELTPHDSSLYLEASWCSSMINDTTNGCRYLELALKNGFTDYNAIAGDDELDNLRHTIGYATIMKKYFPDQYKEK